MSGTDFGLMEIATTICREDKVYMVLYVDKFA